MIYLDPLSFASSIVDREVPTPYYDEYKNIFRKSTTLLLSVQFQSLCHFSLKSWDLSASSDPLSSIPCSSTYFCRYQLKWLWTVSLARFIFYIQNSEKFFFFFPRRAKFKCLEGRAWTSHHRQCSLSYPLSPFTSKSPATLSFLFILKQKCSHLSVFVFAWIFPQSGTFFPW